MQRGVIQGKFQSTKPHQPHFFLQMFGHICTGHFRLHANWRMALAGSRPMSRGTHNRSSRYAATAAMEDDASGGESCAKMKTNFCVDEGWRRNCRSGLGSTPKSGLGPFKPKSPNAPIPSLQKSGSHRAQAFIHFTLLNTLGHGIFGQSFTSESKSSGKNRSDPRKLRGMIDCPPHFSAIEAGT